MTGADLDVIARRQHGLISRPQALSAGVSQDAINRLLRSGRWIKLRPGVYAVAAVPPSWSQAVLAAVLAAGSDAWGSHLTAARSWNVDAPAPEGIDVLTLPRRRVRLDGVTHHRSAEIRLPDVSRVDGIPVTSLARTLVDCLPWLGERGFGRALDDGRRRRLITAEQADEVHSWLDRGRRTGRHKVVPGRQPLAKRVAGQLAGGSNRELDVLGILEGAGLPAPVQQFRVVIGGRERFLDHAYPDRKIALEWDGFETHGLMRDVFDDDRIRNTELQLLGWLILQITSATPPATLVRWVETALAARSA